jgi:arylsulfatase A-like enzyme
MMTNLLCAWNVALLVLLFALLPTRAAAEAKPPNIVIILADDLGINDLTCYGRRDQPTPHLDRLARQGMRFTSAYAEPVCSPTRAALMTGLAPSRLHLTTFLPGRPDTPAQMLLHPKIEQRLPREAKTVVELLKTAGYATACLGKWHLGGEGALPTDRGFDLYFPGNANTKPSATEGGKGEYELTDRAEKYIEENKDRLFFLYLAHNCPHVPLAAKPKQIEKHKDAFNPVYAAMIETLDDCVGRVVAKVDELGLAQQTLIVFMSDNGGLHVLETPNTPSTHNTPFRAGKGFCYEGGLRVPLIARWPGKVKAGTVVDTPVMATDWLPTLLTIADVKPPENLDGVSLFGVLTGSEGLTSRALCWHFPHYTNQGGRPAGVIRQGDWKLMEHYEDGRCELFNLAQDLSETTDLSAKEPAKVADLRGQLEKWRRQVGVQENSGNPNYNPHPLRQLYREVDVSRLAAESKATTMAANLEKWRVRMNAVLARGPAKKSTVEAGPGAILLHAREAKVHGSNLRYESEPDKDTLGSWVQREDWVEWEFDSSSPGNFEVEVLQACGKGSGGATVEVIVAGQTLTFDVEETGHFQRFVPRTIGLVHLEKAGRYYLAVKVKSKPSTAVMDLRRIVLRAAAPES